MAIKNVYKVVKEVLRFVLLIPLAPILFGLVFFFSWVIGKINSIPENLDKQSDNP